MTIRKRTLRRLPPDTRKLARTLSSIDNLVTQARKLIPELAKHEHDAKLMFKTPLIATNPPTAAEDLFPDNDR